jgi:hypothetical protein
MARWIAHLLAVDVLIEPIRELQNAKFTWYVGLDAEATSVGNRLWNGEPLDEKIAGRVTGLFKLIFTGHAPVADELKGEPVYLILAMNEAKLLRLKPQNLVTGLPINHLEAVN